MPKQIAISASRLIKEFSGNRVTNEVNLGVKRNELFCLVGVNGAGKTTLIKVLCNLILPTSSEILINENNILENPKKVSASISLVTGDERN